jgi:hypothetical protein
MTAKEAEELSIKRADEISKDVFRKIEREIADTANLGFRRVQKRYTEMGPDPKKTATMLTNSGFRVSNTPNNEYDYGTYTIEW